MIIAIASGKGGTGKTTIATNLAVLLEKLNQKVRYVDCDVEEPNGHLFLKPQISETRNAVTLIPRIDETKCSACGECVRFCEYKALIRLGKMVMVYPELCHGCSGCLLVCPQGAITEDTKHIGVVETGAAGNIAFVNGRLSIGEAMSPPLIRSVLQRITRDTVTVIDAPPGTSCPVIASIRKADYVVLVTEPTPFGLNDLGLALDMVRELNIAHGVVINRAESGNTDAQDFCKQRHVPVIAEIPDNRRIAETYSRGEMIIENVPGLYERFSSLWQAIRKQVNA